METLQKLAVILQTPVSEPQTATSFEELVVRILDMVERQETQRFQEFFDCVEHELIYSKREIQDRIIIDLLEGLKNQSIWRDIDYVIFENWLGPETHVAWRWLEKKWQGKTSLAGATKPPEQKH